MKPEEIAATTRDFIKKNFLFDNKRTLGADESLLGSRIVDSTGILELIAFLEETYSVTFKDDELVADNFDSVSKIASFIAHKVSNTSG